MRTLLLTSVFILTAAGSFAQDAPVFRPLDPSMSSIEQVMPPPRPVSHSGEVIDSEGAGAIPSLPLQAQEQNGIPYISGGVSDEETDQLKASENNYNLRLLVTGQSGEFVSGVTLTLKDANGNALLTVQDAGPCVYTQVPPGKYVVDVMANGAAKSTRVTVPATAPVKLQIRL